MYFVLENLPYHTVMHERLSEGFTHLTYLSAELAGVSLKEH